LRDASTGMRKIEEQRILDERDRETQNTGMREIEG
jgi:hypothetical protein